jgi:hypothetical protein
MQHKVICSARFIVVTHPHKYIRLAVPAIFILLTIDYGFDPYVHIEAVSPSNKVMQIAGSSAKN